MRQKVPVEWPSYHVQDIQDNETWLAWGPALHKLLLEELIGSAFFRFSHGSKVVNTAIENGTWQFTRGHLVDYFKSMQCGVKLGKGAHEKVSLPHLLKITKDSEIITILSDMGVL
ncbi:hypothetical protein IM40_09135 [Candidatus Paracaedimonas acanthamoebae]|nr:hypothetical protein IM40_09135 [Candidatus Paracaedimonas acanthamoebae]